MFWSSSTLQSQCTWRGAWTEEDLTCRQQAAVILGMGSKPDSVDWEAVAEVYPAKGKNSFLPGLPKDYTAGSAGYADGRLMYCGGMDDGDRASLPVISCFSLAPPLLAWEETWPLLQVTNLPLPNMGLVYGQLGQLNINPNIESCKEFCYTHWNIILPVNLTVLLTL